MAGKLPGSAIQANTITSTQFSTQLGDVNGELKLRGSGISLNVANTAYFSGNVGIGITSPTSALHVVGNTLITQDLTVSGNLLIEGNTTTFNVQTLEIEDNDIVLNSNTTGVPSLNASITIDRGSSTNTFLRWNESADKWGWSDDGSIFYTFDTSLNAYEQANAAYTQANNGYTQANNAYIAANTAQFTSQNAYAQANSAYGQANLAYTQANSAYGQANLAYTQANSAYGQANLAYTQANSAYTQANSAYGQANSAYGQANLAYTAANNRVLKAGDTMTGTLTMGANISFQNDETAYWIKPPFNGGAIRFRSNVGASTDRGLQFGNIDNAGGWTSYMTVNTGGNVGIGTTDPGSALEINGNIWTSGNSNYVLFGKLPAINPYIQGDSGGQKLYIGVNNSSAITIDSARSVGIGTTSPGYKLSVAGASGSAAINLLETGVRSWGIRAGGYATNTFDIADFTAGATRLIIDSSGNFGLGVAPSAWSSFKSLQIGDVGAVASADFTGSNVQTLLGNNVYYGSGGFYYIKASVAAMYRMVGKTHAWSYAESGSAGGAISFTTPMTLDASGNLGIGTTSPQSILNVYLPSTSANVAYLKLDMPGWSNSTGYFKNIVWGDQNVVGAIGMEFSNSTTNMHFHSFYNNAYSSSILMTIKGNGNVGIGTTSPGTKLDVVGSIRANTSDSTYRATFNPQVNYSEAFNITLRAGSANDAKILAYGETSGLVLSSVFSGNPIILSVGNVGIGTTSPGSTLSVRGSTNLGDSHDSSTSALHSTRISGYALRYDASTRYGSYGKLLFNGNTAWTTGARRWLITNGLNATKFAIIRSVDASTDPDIASDAGGISSGNADLVIDNGGNVGINNGSPGYKLDVSGDIHASNELYLDNGKYLRFTRSSGGLSIQTLGIESGTDNVRLLTTGDLNILNGSLTNLMTVKNAGNVGIGTTNPGYPLDVNGIIRGRTQLHMNSGNGAGFPFIMKGSSVTSPGSTWHTVHTFGQYELTAFMLMVAYEDNEGDGNNLFALFADSGSGSYGEGFSITRIHGSSTLECRRDNRDLQVRHSSGGSTGSKNLNWQLFWLQGSGG
jgi:hypothetical protein